MLFHLSDIQNIQRTPRFPDKDCCTQVIDRRCDLFVRWYWYTPFDVSEIGFLACMHTGTQKFIDCTFGPFKKNQPKVPFDTCSTKFLLPLQKVEDVRTHRQISGVNPLFYKDVTSNYGPTENKYVQESVEGSNFWMQWEYPTYIRRKAAVYVLLNAMLSYYIQLQKGTKSYETIFHSNCLFTFHFVYLIDLRKATKPWL